MYNPELLDKKRVLAVTKCDLIDDEIKKSIKNHLPKIPTVFISSVVGQGIDELKDLLWNSINSD
jgi:GTP-binding protein